MFATRAYEIRAWHSTPIPFSVVDDDLYFLLLFSHSLDEYTERTRFVAADPRLFTFYLPFLSKVQER